MTARVIGVRSRITQTISKGNRRETTGVYVRNVVVKNGDANASLENGQSAIERATPW